LAGAMAVIFHKKQRLANIIPNITCIMASLIGIIASITYIFKGTERISILKSNLSIPLMSINLSFDGLTAFFVLSLSVLVFAFPFIPLGILHTIIIEGI
jgi:hypothetical protein